jgi:hypothetical protein
MAGDMVMGAGLQPHGLFPAHAGNHHPIGKQFSDPKPTTLYLYTSSTAASSSKKEWTKHTGLHQ